MYLSEFKSTQDIIKQFAAEPDILDGAKVLLAWYECPPYEGYSFVLFERDGKLYENNASHCSCYGLEGQWAPTEVTWAALKMRKYPPSGGTDEANKALKDLIAQNYEEN